MNNAAEIDTRLITAHMNLVIARNLIIEDMSRDNMEIVEIQRLIDAIAPKIGLTVSA